MPANEYINEIDIKIRASIYANETPYNENEANFTVNALDKLFNEPSAMEENNNSDNVKIESSTDDTSVNNDDNKDQEFFRLIRCDDI